MVQRTLIFLAGLLWAAGASAQTTRVRGQVTDAADGKPLQFVSVVFPGTTTGITTDEQGIYALETRDTVSRVQASMVGYATRTLPLTPGTFNHVDFALEAVEFGIGQVVITPGENPAYPILDGVIRNKPLNDPERYDTYSCRTYTKMELDLTNIRPQFRSRRLQRNFGFVFDYVDTSALTGQAYLPAMISESTADLYRSSHPAFKREVIRASRISGVEDNFAAAQFTGGMHGDVNFYDNFIDIFNVRFASPLSDGGRAFYNYFLVDSMVTEGRKVYKIRFHPKRLTTPVLDGEVNIDSASYALQSASARMPKGVNVNWIRHLMLDNENRPADKGRWFRVRDRVSAEFSVSTADSSKLTSFIGTREVAYSDVRIGEPIPDEVLRMDNNVVVRDEEPGHRREEFWEQVRPYSLSEKEKGIYAMVDSVQHVPLYRNIYTLINTVIVGYWNTKYIGIGPYYKLARFNKLEGFRMQLGGRIFGKVPYQLLKLHEGNGTYFYDPYAFSCMNFYEFASDAWVSWFWEHHFNGVLLGRLPLIKKLKWREVLVCKGVWGTLSRENNGSTAGTQADLLFPAGMTSVSDPYVEAGFGVENIFRLFRVDCIWRLTHRSPKPGQEIQNFAVNLSLHLKF